VAPLRALFLSSYSGLGGGETSLLALFAALDRSRVVPVLACAREGPLPDAARRLDVDVHVVPWRGASVWFVPSVWAAAPAVTRIARCVAQLRPAVIHTDFHALPYASAVSRRAVLPLVFGCYGWWFRPRPWQRSLYRRPQLTIVAISEAVRTGFLGSPPFALAPAVTVVPLGVDPAVCRPRREDRRAIRELLGLAADRPLVSMVARFQHVKGHDVFLEMARHVLREAPDAQFAIAGENVFGGSPEARFKRATVNSVARDPVLAGSVRLLGWISRSEELIAASDVVVCSSRFESFGMVPVEAMACEVPVVSTNVGGPAETILDGRTGYLVPPERPDLLAARVLRLLTNPAERRAFGAAGRQRVLDRFSVARYAARLTDVLEGAAARAQSGGDPTVLAAITSR
jgi:glycosyltransferase involved in cell wall biosynthesis